MRQNAQLADLRKVVSGHPNTVHGENIRTGTTPTASISFFSGSYSCAAADIGFPAGGARSSSSRERNSLRIGEVFALL